MVMITLIFAAAVLVLMIPISTLLLQALAALLPKEHRKEHFDTSELRTAVIIPAHNEALSIAATIGSVKSQISDKDRIVVVADNCTDDTGSIAASAGVEVVTRNDATRIGKGYALDFGIRYVAHDAPDVIVILDADCLLRAGSLPVLIEECARQKAPVQAMYTMASSPQDQGAQIAEFAWRIKGVLRPMGFMRLGLPCHLKGTGMAFPWDVLRECNLATSHITEDLLLGIELAFQGKPTRFCPHANVISQLPSSEKGRKNQRERWIHGYFSVVRQYLPKLFTASLRRTDIALFALACDLSVPPLVVLILLCSLAFLATAFWYVATGEVVPLAIGSANIGMLTAFLILAWAYCGRDLIGRREVTLALGHFSTVLQIVFFYMTGRRRQWIRAERKK